jgi:hypothetical protein
VLQQVQQRLMEELLCSPKSQAPKPPRPRSCAPSPISRRQVRRAAVAVMRLPPLCPAVNPQGSSASSLANRHRIRGKISLGFEGWAATHRVRRHIRVQPQPARQPATRRRGNWLAARSVSQSVTRHHSCTPRYRRTT